TPLRKILAPHSESSFKMTVRNDGTLPAGEFPPLRIETCCGYEIWGDAVSIPMRHQILTDWPHKVPFQIKCRVPDFVKEDWDWKGPEDGWFEFEVYTRKGDLVISFVMHDDIHIAPDRNDPSIPHDRIDILLESGGKIYNWKATENGEVTLPLKKLKDGRFLFNISFTDSDNVRNIKPAVLWWRRQAVECSL
ncbi:MAG: hypothetical protein ACI4QG_06055, partial [Candidatus Cryptobacteroides sp.]